MAGVLAVTAAPAGATTAPTGPQSPQPAPAKAEGFAPYLPQVSCDPVAKPGTLSLRSTMMAAFGGRDLGIVRACDVGGLSEHKEGRAWDWGLDASKPQERALAEQFLAWLMAPGPNGMAGLNARRLGVMYVIYNGKIWSSYRVSEGWRSYTGGESHSSHLHISLSWNGAMARSSWWTGEATPVDYGPCVKVEGEPASPWSGPRDTPCPQPVSAMSLTGTPLLRQGDSGAYVLQLQRLLKVSPTTGYFGPLTEAAVVSLQERTGLPVTGTTTPQTWTAARAGAPPAPTPTPTTTPTPTPTTPSGTVTWARSLPARLSYTAQQGDNLTTIARRWRSTVAAITDANRLRSDVIRVGQRLTVPVRSSLTRYTWTRLERGDKGAAVKALQTALRMRPKYRTGLYGPITTRRVNALKAGRGWVTDGKVGPGVWRALGA